MRLFQHVYWGLFLLVTGREESFSFPCRHVLLYRGLFDNWGFLCIIVESLPYNKKHLQITVVIILCYILNFIELN